MVSVRHRAVRCRVYMQVGTNEYVVGQHAIVDMFQ